jgi:hypothetical protein
MRVPERREIAEAYSRGETLMSAGDEWRDELLGCTRRSRRPSQQSSPRLRVKTYR